jgi:hypothetical protein
MRGGIVRLPLVLWILMFEVALVPVARPASLEQGPPLQESASFGRYVANTYFNPASNSKDADFKILKDKRCIYRQQATRKDEKFVIGTLYDDDPDARLVSMDRDITGDGQPDLVISEWLGAPTAASGFISSKSARSSERSPTSMRRSAIGAALRTPRPRPRAADPDL